PEAGSDSRHTAFSVSGMPLDSGRTRSLVLVADLENHAPIRESANVRDVHRESISQLRSARGCRVRGVGVVRGAGIRHLVQEVAWPRRSLDPMRSLQEGPIADDVPDEQTLGRQAVVEALLTAVLEKQVLGAIGAKKHLETFPR